MTEQQIREQFANDLKARFTANIAFGHADIFWYWEVEQLINETLNVVVQDEREIEKQIEELP